MSDMRRFIDYIAEPDDLVALVLLDGNIHGRSTGKNAIGFYQNRERFFDEAESLDGHGNVYTNLNRLNPDVYGRAADRFRTFSPTRFSDSEIERRRALFIDLDSIRVSGVNSSEEELQAAIELAQQIAAYLQELWGVEPLFVMTGNGAQLHYLIDEPAESKIVEQVLKNLHERFSTNKVKIDTSVSDAARITRLPGAVNCKGDDVPGRPRRRAYIVSMPDERIVVSTEQLEMLVPDEPTSSAAAEPSANRGDWTHDKLRVFLDTKYQGPYRTITDTGKGYDEGIAYDLETCPFIDHGDEKWKTRISLINGRPGFKCFHNSCSNPKKTFRDFREKFSPEPPLAITDELRLARHVVSTFSRNGVPTIRYFRRDWYLWDSCWRRMEEDEFNSLLYRTCKDYILHQWPPDLVDRNGNPKPAPRLSRALIGNVALALMSLVTITETGWVDGRGGRWIAFKDQLLDLDAWLSGAVVCVPQTPQYFAPTALPYPLSHTEAEPTIMLEKLREQVTEHELAALQEFGGYCLTDEIPSHQFCKR